MSPAPGPARPTAGRGGFGDGSGGGLGGPATHRLRHLAGPDARRAHVETARGAVDQCPHTLDVRVPAALRPAMRVAEAHAERRVLATDFAHSSHDADAPRGNLGDEGKRLA